MSGLRIIKYFKGPSFTADIWSARNPYLKSGEIGYLLEGGITIAAKVGPGYWNDLGFIGEDVYPHTEDVTNEIGDASGNLQGTKVIDILKLMLSPYETPSFLNIQNNAGGTFAPSRSREIGQITSGPINIIYNVLNSQNLSGATPINITAAGVFTNEGDFADTGNIALSLAAPLNPVTPLNIVITLKANHLNGITSGVDHTTTISYSPRILWMSSQNPSVVTGSVFMSSVNLQSVVSNEFKRDYTMPGNGYIYLAIPAMLSPSNLMFAEVTNPNAPSHYYVKQVGQYTINNGVGSYSYIIYRSEFFIIQPTKLRVS